MQKKLYSLSLGTDGVTLPKEAADAILAGKASEEEIKVLLAASVLGGCELTIEDIAKLCGVGLDEVNTALSFWRGAGVIAVHVKRQNGSEIPKTTEKQAASAYEIPQTTQNEPEQITLQTEVRSVSSEPETPKTAKKLLSRDMPKYTALEISEMVEKDGGRLRDMIDECQQLLGHIFTPHETQVLVGMCEWLKVEPEYITTLTAYLINKKSACPVSYIEKTAVELVNQEITDLVQLDLYIKNKELYDGVAGKLRILIGIGERAYTKKENGMINAWVNTYGYGIEIIKRAYEECCNLKGEFIFSYTDTILENWYKAGVRTPEDAEKQIADFKSSKGVSGKKGSFDTDEFFDLALKRTYKNMTKR